MDEILTIIMIILAVIVANQHILNWFMLIIWFQRSQQLNSPTTHSRKRTQTAACCSLFMTRNSPVVWKKPRSMSWYECTVLTKWEDNDDRWIQHFRMPLGLLQQLRIELLDDISPDPLAFRSDTIQSFKCLAIGIMTLASCSEYRIIGELFGVSEISVGRCTMKVSD